MGDDDLVEPDTFWNPTQSIMPATKTKSNPKIYIDIPNPEYQKILLSWDDVEYEIIHRANIRNTGRQCDVLTDSHVTNFPYDELPIMGWFDFVGSFPYYRWFGFNQTSNEYLTDGKWNDAKSDKYRGLGIHLFNSQKDIESCDLYYMWVENVSPTSFQVISIAYAKNLGKTIIIGGKNKNIVPEWIINLADYTNFHHKATWESALRYAITPAYYRWYISSDEWRIRANEAKRKAGYRCQVCNRNNNTLDAHHRTYDRLGNEAPEDITVLCRDCHALFEENKKAQKKK